MSDEKYDTLGGKFVLFTLVGDPQEQHKPAPIAALRSRAIIGVLPGTCDYTPPKKDAAAVPSVLMMPHQIKVCYLQLFNGVSVACVETFDEIMQKLNAAEPTITFSTKDDHHG